jgi:protein-arginine kinase activator protein McsA
MIRKAGNLCLASNFCLKISPLGLVEGRDLRPKQKVTFPDGNQLQRKGMMKMMEAVDFTPYAKYRDEIKDLKKKIDSLQKMNAELNQKVIDIYGAYETLQYTTRGRLMSCSAEIVRLRQEIDTLKRELHARGWEEQ